MSELLNKDIQIAALDPSDLEGNLSDVVEYLNGMINDHEKGDTSIEWDSNYKSFIITYTRKETLDEANKRINRERKYAGQVKDREIATFKELQKKYGD